MLMVNAVLPLLFLGHSCLGLPLWSFDKYDASHRCYWPGICKDWEHDTCSSFVKDSILGINNVRKGTFLISRVLLKLFFPTSITPKEFETGAPSHCPPDSVPHNPGRRGCAPSALLLMERLCLGWVTGVSCLTQQLIYFLPRVSIFPLIYVLTNNIWEIDISRRRRLSYVEDCRERPIGR